MTGKRTAAEAAAMAECRSEGELRGEWARRRRESLMVGPVTQPRARRACAAAEREASSRWPRQMLMGTWLGCASSSMGRGQGAAEGVAKNGRAHEQDIVKELHKGGVGVKGDAP